MKTLVIGASHKAERYANRAMHLLDDFGHEVVPLGRREREYNKWTILEGKPALKDIDTVTLYLNPRNQEEYEDYILQIQPRRVIFNPGTENPLFAQRLEAAGIASEEACTLVLLQTGQY